MSDARAQARVQRERAGAIRFGLDSRDERDSTPTVTPALRRVAALRAAEALLEETPGLRELVALAEDAGQSDAIVSVAVEAGVPERVRQVLVDGAMPASKAMTAWGEAHSHEHERSALWEQALIYADLLAMAAADHEDDVR
jgi:hypothetical protein